MQLIHLFREYYEPETEPTFPNPLPYITADDPRMGDWFDRAEAVIDKFLSTNPQGAPTQPLKRFAWAQSQLSQEAELPIDQIIGTESHLDPVALKRKPGDKFSSEFPTVYKVDGNYMAADGNHRIVQAHLEGKDTIRVALLDVDNLPKSTGRRFGP